MGVPHIDPLSSPKINPLGRSGEMSQFSGVEPEVCPAIVCIATPSVSNSESVGKVRKMPFPTIQIVTSVLALPPELFA